MGRATGDHSSQLAITIIVINTKGRYRVACWRDAMLSPLRISVATPLSSIW